MKNIDKNKTKESIIYRGKVNYIYNDFWIKYQDLCSLKTNHTLKIGKSIIGYFPNYNDEIDYCFYEIAIYCLFLNINMNENIVCDLIDNMSFNNISLSDYIEDSTLLGIKNNKIFIRNAWYINDVDLRLYIQSMEQDKTFVIRMFQASMEDFNEIILVGEYLIVNEYNIVDLQLINPYFPILISISTNDAEIISMHTIAFPSLLQNGLHFSEFNYYNAKNPKSNIYSIFLKNYINGVNDITKWALSQIYIDMTNSIGSEDILSSYFQQWLKIIMKIKTKNLYDIENLSGGLFSKREENKLYALILPANALPSLYILVVSLYDNINSIFESQAYLLVKEYSDISFKIIHNPLKSYDYKKNLTVPHQIVNPFLYSIENNKINTKTCNKYRVDKGLSIAVVKQNYSQQVVNLIKPFSPDIKQIVIEKLENKLNIKVVILCMDNSSQSLYPNTFIESMEKQIGIDYEILTIDNMENKSNIIKIISENEFVLCIKNGVILHDNRTIKTLVNIILKDDFIASIGCISLENTKNQDSIKTLFPKLLLKNNNETLRIEETNLFEILPYSIYPVITNNNLMLIRSDIFLKLKGLSYVKENNIDFFNYSINAIKQGYINLSTNLVSIGCITLDSQNHDIESISTKLCYDLLNSSLMIEEFKR